MRTYYRTSVANRPEGRYGWTIRFHSAVLIPVVTIILSGCGRSVPLTTEETNYLVLVESIELPLLLRNDIGLSDTIRARAIRWIEKYADYPIVTRSSWEVATLLPTDEIQGGYGYIVSWGVPKEEMVVTINAYIADPSGHGRSIGDPRPARMLGLYLRDGILPPTDRVGFAR